MSNTLNAIRNLVTGRNTDVDSDTTISVNRIQSVGAALEKYIKDLYASTQGVDEQTRMQLQNKVFSYTGNSKNPPDVMIRGGDAIEIKKIASLSSDIALNSSYPKSKLLSTNPYITRACVNCEQWKSKDLVYAIGSIPENKLTSLWLVYGDCYAADIEVYANLKNRLITEISKIPDVDFAESKELGRVNEVDPLGITYLRIRGMWHIQHPSKVFEYLNRFDSKPKFQLNCIMKEEKYNSFSCEDIEALENLTSENFTIINEEIKDPNNPSNLINAKVITFKIY